MSPVFFLAAALAGTWAFFLGVWVGYAMRKVRG